MTDADRNDLSGHSLPVAASAVEIQLNSRDAAPDHPKYINRGERQDELGRLRGDNVLSTRLQYVWRSKSLRPATT